jgi:hypothetical protein
MAKPIYTAEAHVTGGRVHGHGRTSDGVLEVDLRTLGVTNHVLRLRGSTASRAGVQLFGAGWVGPHSFAAVGLRRRVAARRDVRPVGGVWLVDTTSWQARRLATPGQQFLVRKDRLLIFGPAFGPPWRLPGRGMTIDGFDLRGRHLYRLHPGRQIASVFVVDGYIHTMPFRLLRRPGAHVPNRPRSVFDLETGRNLGRISRPPPNLVPLDQWSFLVRG